MSSHNETAGRQDTKAFIPDNNPIESTFATVRYRIDKTKDCLSRKTGLAMAFKLMLSAQVKWRKLDGSHACLRSFRALPSSTGSSNFNQPPDQAVTNLSGIAHDNPMLRFSRLLDDERAEVDERHQG